MWRRQSIACLLAGLALTAFAAPGRCDPDRLLQDLAKNRRDGFTFDYANVIVASDRQAIDSALAELEQKTAAQVKVVTLPSLEGGEINDFAVRLYEKWGIGQRGKNNGVLFLAAIQDRKTRLEVGYGLEGALPDAKAGRLLDERVLPRFKAGDMSGGMREGALSIAQIVAREYGVELSQGASPAASISGELKIGGPFQILIIIVFLLLVFRHPWLLFFLGSGCRGSSGRSSGGFGGGGFSGGGFGGGMSGGGGASRGW